MTTRFGRAVLMLGLALVVAVPPTVLEAAAGSADGAGRVAELQRQALAGDGAYRLVESLTTEVGPRFSGTPGDRLAIAWAESKLGALGFAPVHSESVAVPRWVRGSATGEIVTPWPQSVAILALGGSIGTAAEGIAAEVVGVEDIAALVALPEGSVRGKIVYFGKRMRRTSDGAGYIETVPIRGRGAVAAAQRGALAVLVRSVGTDSNRLPHTGGMRYEEGVPRIPAAALAVPDADLLERQLAAGRPVVFRLGLSAQLAGESESANTIGEIRGRERPEEIVLLIAHRDSWDVGTGAQDNATGVALAIEAARLVAAVGGPPRRTIRVVLTANEEFGLSGARAYAVAHAAELPQHTLAIELDSGAGRVLSLATRFAPSDAAAEAELESAFAPLAIPLSSEPAGGGADLSPIAPHGLPLVDLDQDRTLYFDLHHTENDTLDKIDPAALAQVTAALATVVDWAANREVRLAAVAVEQTPP